LKTYSAGMTERSSSWSIQYATNEVPWDLGQAHNELVTRLEDDPTLGLTGVGTVLVPGCGSGYDAATLADYGWDVTALDFAASAQLLVEQKLDGRGRFVLADLFEYRAEEPFDLVLDHTCFCAIPPQRRADFGKVMHGVIRPGGLFISIVFPDGKPMEHGGPPHGMTVHDLTRSLGDTFQLLRDEEADCNGRRWNNRWSVFVHNSS